MKPEESNTGITFDNPYVGPSAFEAKHKKLFFGRDREAKELVSLLLARRLVLFYSESGAGKSSLVNARLIPSLEDPRRGFEVLPKCRVISGEAPAGLEVDNIFAFNLMLELDQSDVKPERFAEMGLSDFLLSVAKVDGKFYYIDDDLDAGSDDAGDLGDREDVPLAEILPRVLIIDQFEEIFTSHLWAWDQREAFFRQLSRAMGDDPFLYVVLVMREDFVARLDPYVHLLPGELRTRYYMQRMRATAALDAVQKPAKKADREFDKGVAEELVDNLRLLRTVDQEGKTSLVSGEYIEPVQLQVVCYQLWEDLKDAEGDKITDEDVKRLARNALAGRDRVDVRRLEDTELLSVFIDTALAGFYERALAKVMLASEIDVDESYLRDWFSHKLITDEGTRGFLNRGKEETAGVPEPIVALIEKERLVRTDTRAGAEWIELVHDRFVAPIQEANRNWTKRRIRQTPWVGAAYRWEDKDRNPALLLQDGILDAALQAAGDIHRQPRIVREFLEASTNAQTGREQKLAEDRAEAAHREQELAEERAKVERRERELAEQRAEADRRERGLAERRAAEEAAINKRLRWQRIGLVAASSIAVIALIIAVLYWQKAEDKATTVEEQKTELSVKNTKLQERTDELDGINSELTEQSGELNRVAGELRKQTEAANKATALAKALRLASLSQDYLEINNTAGALLAAVETAREMPDIRQTQSALLAAFDKVSLVGDDIVPQPPEPEHKFTGLAPSPLSGTTNLFPGPHSTTLATLTNGEIVWWDIEASEHISHTYPIPDTRIEQAIFSSDRSLVAIADDSGKISIWTVDDNAASEKWNSPSSEWKRVTALAFSPDGSKLAASGCNVEEPAETCRASKIQVWELNGEARSLKKVETPETDDHAVLELTFNKNGSMLLWMDQLGEIEFRELQIGGNTGFLPKLEGGRYTSMVVHPDGQLLVGGCRFQEEEESKEQCHDGFVQWWSLPDSNPIGTTQISNSSILDVATVPNSDVLIALDDEGRVIWLADDTAAWPELACLAAGRNMTYDEWKEAFPRQSESDYQNTCRQYRRNLSYAERKMKEGDLRLRRCQTSFTRQAQSLFEDAFSLVLESDSELSFNFLDRAVQIQLVEASARVGQIDEIGARRCLDQISGNLLGEDDSLESSQILPILRQIALGQKKYRENEFVEAYRILALVEETVQAADLPSPVLKAVEAMLVEEYKGICLSNVSRTERIDAVCGRLTELLDADENTIQLNSEVQSTTQEITLWIFTGAAGDIINIGMGTESGDFDPYLTLLDSSGRELISDDDSGDGLNALISGYLLTETGPYYVRTGRSGSIADYTLSLNNADVETIELGESVISTTEEKALWMFRGTEGEIITLDLQGASEDFDPYLAVTAPDGSERNDDDGGGGYAGFDARIYGYVLPVSGRYLIRVGRDNSNAPYTLSLETTDIEVLELTEQITEMLDSDQMRQALALLEKSPSEIAARIPLEVRALLCLYGAIDGHEQTVLSLCEEVVTESSIQPDSDEALIAKLGHGMALALAGEMEAALSSIETVILMIGEDLEFEDRARFERWISLLRQNQNPFDEDELEWLRENL